MNNENIHLHVDMSVNSKPPSRNKFIKGSVDLYGYSIVVVFLHFITIKSWV